MHNDRLTAIRAALPATRSCVYLNTGTCGPIPEPAFASMQAAARDEYEQGRIGPASGRRQSDAREAARQLMADLVHASPAEIGLTHHTTEGLNIVLAGMAWQSGDEVITTDAEHGSLLLPLRFLARRFGVQTHFANTHGLDAVEAIARLITDRTKLVALSHVSYATGTLFPLPHIVELAHRRGIPVLVDGAQSAGAIPLDLPAIEVDYYAMPGQKWLCGPDGTGALYVRADACDRLAQTFVGYLSMQHEGEGKESRPYAGPRRFEVGSQGLPDLLGQAESVRWLRDEVGLDWIYQRTAALGARMRELLLAQPGIDVLTPTNAAGLTCFTVQGNEPTAVVQALADDQIIIRSIGRPSCCRISSGFFNTEEELERVADRVGALVR